MRFLIALFILLATTPSWAQDVVVKDGGTIQLNGVIYRLDGIDAPAFDQICLNEFADPVACGVEAREQLSKLLGAKGVRCDDLGPDKSFGKWHLGVCTAEGDRVSLNQAMVQKGFG